MKDQNIWMCSECGYFSNARFENDICPSCRTSSWKCSECGFIAVAAIVPPICPECMESYHFINLTSYIPDWGATEAHEIIFPE